jgi:putative pyruvate formate lyase activating enzyme
MVSSAGPHFGEEEPLVGSLQEGSGTVFLTRCNLRCVFCQNYDISHLGIGEEWSEEKLAEVLLVLQRRGCANVNFVTPTHYAPQLVKALGIARDRGLTVPVVWNCGGYEDTGIIRMLEGMVDIYMPDCKFGDNSTAARYCNAPDYVDRCQRALREMHRQVGDLELDDQGRARRGLLVRHLVMPADEEGSRQVLEFLAREISRDTWVNIMDQYRPAGDAGRHPQIRRRPTAGEYHRVLKIARELGLHRGFETVPGP